MITAVIYCVSAVITESQMWKIMFHLHHIWISSPRDSQWHSHGTANLYPTSKFLHFYSQLPPNPQ